MFPGIARGMLYARGETRAKIRWFGLSKYEIGLLVVFVDLEEVLFDAL